MGRQGDDERCGRVSRQSDSRQASSFEAQAGEALPWAAVMLVISICITWAAVQIPWIGSSSAVMMLLGLQVLTLAVGGSRQINTSLGGVRESGILDFHRVSPLPPWRVALGFFLRRRSGNMHSRRLLCPSPFSAHSHSTPATHGEAFSGCKSWRWPYSQLPGSSMRRRCSPVSPENPREVRWRGQSRSFSWCS